MRFLRTVATIIALYVACLGVEVASKRVDAQTTVAPAKVHLELTQDQLNVVLNGLSELKFKDVLGTYMAIVQQAVPGAGAAPAEPQPSVALPSPAPPAPLPAPPGDAHLLQLAPGTKSDLAPDKK